MSDETISYQGEKHIFIVDNAHVVNIPSRLMDLLVMGSQVTLEQSANDQAEFKTIAMKKLMEFNTTVPQDVVRRVFEHMLEELKERKEKAHANKSDDAAI